MNVIKICLRDNVEDVLADWIQSVTAGGRTVQVQRIDNTPYLKWLSGSLTVNWKIIIDVFPKKSAVNEFEKLDEVGCDFIQSLPPVSADIYLVSQVSYQSPISNAELIISCYQWNYENAPEFRHEKMLEHFEMEKTQKYYDYVAFQCVEKILSSESMHLDFFFESHVSDPEGINEIYSKPALEGMREHSMAFLNTGTRQLSFGRVTIEE